MTVASDVAAELRDHIGELAVALVGAEPTLRTRQTWRFHARGGLTVEVGGRRRGLWCDHAAGVGGDALDLVRHQRGGSTADALAWARSWLGHAPGQPRPAEPALPLAPEPADEVEERQWRQDSALRVWRQASNAAGTDVERYLAGRGLALPACHPDVIRYHPCCPRGEGAWPAMVALMRDPETGAPCGVHRTFLALSGTAKASGVARQMLGVAGVIHLTDLFEVSLGLGIVEGIENGLALLQVAGWAPIWACCSAGGIARFPVLPGIEALTVFADADDGGAGVKAARTCAERWSAAGREVAIELPPAGSDWNDVTRRVTA